MQLKEFEIRRLMHYITSSHCSAYSLEVFDNDPETMETVSLGKFALNPYPIHHPEGKDIALIHLKQEEETLKILTEDLGVDILRLRDLDGIYDKGDEVTFDGYVVAEANQADSETFGGEASQDDNDSSSKTSENDEEDDRVFYPYSETGNLSFHTRDRFFATTPEPLPEGLCGNVKL